MWVFSKNTIAGDLGVTPIVQCLASMLITSTLVHSDLHHSAVKPLPYVYPHVEHLPDPRTILSPSFRRQQRENPSPTPPPVLRSSSSDSIVIDEKKRSQETNLRGIRYWYWMLIRFIFEGTERNMLLARPGFGNWWGRFIWTAAQGAGVGIVFGFPIWCLAVLILGPIYGNGNMGNKWAPQVIKLVYGAIVGWVTNPVIAVLALGSQADHHLILVEKEGDEEGTIEGGEQIVGDQTAIPPTIQEEGEAGYTLGPPGTPRRVPPSPRSTIIPSPLARNVPLGTPLSQRVRSYSNVSSSSHRPPLTANVSGLSPLPAPHIPLSTPIETLATPERPVYGRERGMTVSSVSSGYSYALGGTGGRAKRSRSTTSASATGLGLGLGSGNKDRPPIPNVMVSNADPTVGESEAGQESTTRPRAGSWDVFGRRTTAPAGVPTLSTRPAEGGASPRTPHTLAALGEVRESRELDRP
jgi:hypothetical protein